MNIWHHLIFFLNLKKIQKVFDENDKKGIYLS